METASIFKLSFYNIRYYTLSKKDEIKYSGIGIEFSYSKIMANFEAILKCMIWDYKVTKVSISTMLCCCTILLLTTANGKTKKAACVCGNWFGTKNGAQTLVGGFLQEIRAESRLICYCTSWQRTPILVGATPAEAVYEAKAQDGGIGKVFPKLRFVYTKAIQLHKVCVNAPPRYWSGQRHNHHSS